MAKRQPKTPLAGALLAEGGDRNTLILEAFRLRRAKLFYKDGEVSAEWEERK